MRGISTIIVVILLLMISISMAGFGYMFFTTMFTSITGESEEVLGGTIERMLAQMKIESITRGSPTRVYIRNTGKVDLTNFTAYVEGNLVTFTPPSENKIVPGQVKDLNIISSVSEGDVIKITTAQGAMAVQTAPA